MVADNRAYNFTPLALFVIIAYRMLFFLPPCERCARYVLVLPHSTSHRHTPRTWNEYEKKNSLSFTDNSTSIQIGTKKHARLPIVLYFSNVYGCVYVCLFSARIYHRCLIATANFPFVVSFLLKMRTFTEKKYLNEVLNKACHGKNIYT